MDDFAGALSVLFMSYTAAKEHRLRAELEMQRENERRRRENRERAMREAEKRQRELEAKQEKERIKQEKAQEKEDAEFKETWAYKSGMRINAAKDAARDVLDKDTATAVCEYLNAHGRDLVRVNDNRLYNMAREEIDKDIETWEQDLTVLVAHSRGIIPADDERVVKAREHADEVVADYKKQQEEKAKEKEKDAKSKDGDTEKNPPRRSMASRLKEAFEKQDKDGKEDAGRKDGHSSYSSFSSSGYSGSTENDPPRRSMASMVKEAMEEQDAERAQRTSAASRFTSTYTSKSDSGLER